MLPFISPGMQNKRKEIMLPFISPGMQQLNFKIYPTSPFFNKYLNKETCKIVFMKLLLAEKIKYALLIYSLYLKLKNMV